MSKATWTIAYRKPRANRFVRPTNFTGTWAQAKALAAVFAERNPDLQVYYVPSREAELAGEVVVEDIANVLVETGRRVRIVEQGEVEADLIARVPAADVALRRWKSDEVIPEIEPALAQLAAERGFELRWVKARMPFEIYGAGSHMLRMNFRDEAALREWLAGHAVIAEQAPTVEIAKHEAERLATDLLFRINGEPAREQVRAWWERHGLDKLTGITAANVLDAREADHAEALALA